MIFISLLYRLLHGAWLLQNPIPDPLQQAFLHLSIIYLLIEAILQASKITRDKVL
jgi:hypothetical protein